MYIYLKLYHDFLTDIQAKNLICFKKILIETKNLQIYISMTENWTDLMNSLK